MRVEGLIVSVDFRRLLPDIHFFEIGVGA